MTNITNVIWPVLGYNQGDSVRNITGDCKKYFLRDVLNKIGGNNNTNIKAPRCKTGTFRRIFLKTEANGQTFFFNHFDYL